MTTLGQPPRWCGSVIANSISKQIVLDKSQQATKRLWRKRDLK
jgi:hypothetical protein